MKEIKRTATLGEQIAQPVIQPVADEFRALSRTIAERREQAQQAREEAQKEWQQRLSEASNTRMAVAERLKPKDTTREQRNLRRLAIGQSVGELLGAMFGGIIGLGKGGGGYVPRMPGMAGQTLNRLTALKEKGIMADRQYQGMISQLLSQNAADRISLAQDDYRRAQGDESQAAAMQDNIAQQHLSNIERIASRDKDIAARKELFGLQVAAGKEAAEKNHRNKLSKQQAKDSSIATPPSDEFVRTKRMLLPSTERVMNRGLVEVVDKQSYNKQDDEYAASLAHEVLPIRQRYNLSDRDIQRLQGAMVASPYSSSFTWNFVANALNEQHGVDEIVAYINDKSTKGDGK